MRYSKKRGTPFLFVGLLVALMPILNHIIMETYRTSKTSVIDLTNTSFLSWIGFDSQMTYMTTFYFLLPFCCSLGWSLYIFEDVQSGFVQWFVLKKGKTAYWLHNSLMCFIYGFFTIFIPLLLDFFMAWVFLPSLTPDWFISKLLAVTPDTTYLSSLFYTKPELLIFIYIIAAGLLAGLVANVTGLVALFVNRKVYLVISMPIFIMIVGALKPTLPNLIIDPISTVIPLSAYPLTNIFTVITVYIGLLLLVQCLGMWRMKNVYS